MNNTRERKGRFGTFAGVFTPTILTILGLILFLRTGWVVGRAGIIGAVVIILLANAISALTAFSISAVSTNMMVKAGGIYYMISRTLGLEIGGAIGIPLYFSQTISVAFYIIGFTEALHVVYPIIPQKITATTCVVFFGCLAYVGAGWILRFQYAILAVLAASLLSFFAGGWGEIRVPEMPGATSLIAATPFWEVFAVFFPAVTGIAVGVSMSGDLRDPGKSIPLGTFAAVGASCVIYLSAAVWIGLHADAKTLLTEPMIMKQIAVVPSLITAGVFVSTLSSALGSILAAPRTLQALAADRVAPVWFRSRLGSDTEPRAAVIVTTAAATGIIWIGDLNFVAVLITMFFLNTYAMINLTAGIETLVGNPSFRPRFTAPWYVSISGAAGCYGAMFLIHAPATVVALFISYGVYLLLKHRALKQNWDDIKSGLWFALARFSLIRLESISWRVKNWRPNVVVFTGPVNTSQSREHLINISDWLSTGLGIVSVFHLLVGRLEELAQRGLRTTSCRFLQNHLNERGIIAFSECAIVTDLYTAMANILQIHGIAGIEPNTALMGWGRTPAVQRKQVDLMRQLVLLKKSVLFLSYDARREFGRYRRIDVWWRGRDHNADLMLLLAHIIGNSPPWEGADIRVIRLVERKEAAEGAKLHMADFLRSVRVKATPEVIVQLNPARPFVDVLRETCRETDIVFLGARVPSAEETESYLSELNHMLSASGTTIITRSGETEDLLETG